MVHGVCLLPVCECLWLVVFFYVFLCVVCDCAALTVLCVLCCLWLRDLQMLNRVRMCLRVVV